MRQIGRNTPYTIEEIKQYLTDHDLGISLISTKYENARAKLEFICDYCEFKFPKLFKDIQTRGKGCPACSQNKERVSKQYIKDFVNNYDYEIVSNIEGDIKRGSIFTVKCFRGHITETSWRVFNTEETSRGGVCKECSKEGFGRDRRKCMKEYNNNIKYWGYTYQGDILTHSTDRRDFICKNGHLRNITYDALKTQPNCPECRGFIHKHTEETLAKALSQVNMEFIGVYENDSKKIVIKCHCGETTFGWLSDLIKFGKCRECNNRKLFTFQDKIEYYNKHNCTLLEIVNKGHREESIFKCKCGEIEYRTWSTFKRNPSCSKCAQLNRRRGENHPCWNPLLTDEERLKSRKYPEYKEWRLSVYERDNYTCQCCFDNTGGNLEAHHVLNHSDHYELRLDINNGVTLCSICHQDFHMTYGFTDNNREQLNEFLEEFHLELINSI